MNGSKEVRRYRINPVEIAIFSIVSLIFINSVYNLFTDKTTFSEIAEQSQARQPASVVKTPQNIEISCDKLISQGVDSDRVRIAGLLCGSGEKLLKTQILNTTNHYTASVFIEENAGKYQTDFIPLMPGLNKIKIEFNYSGNQSFGQEIELTVR